MTPMELPDSDIPLSEDLALAEQMLCWLREHDFKDSEQTEQENIKLLFVGCARWLACVSQVFREVTGGAVTDPCTEPLVVIAAYRRHLLRSLNAASKEVQ